MADRKTRPRGGPKRAAPVQRPMTENPDFKALVTERTRFAWILSIVMIVVYFAFILLVAFDGGLMATTIGAGPTTLGIVLGLAIIVFAFVLTGVYVARANSRFDDLTARLKGGR